MLAIALVVVVTVLVVKPDSGPSGPSNAGSDRSNSEFASANDTGLITIITEDPSCAAWVPVINTLADASKGNGWGQRDPSIRASAWSPEQRTQYQEVGNAMRAAADQTESLTKLTTHRIMRQLYEQFTAYTEAYTDAISAYTERDNALARKATQASNILTAICDAIRSGSAAARASLVPAAAAPASATQAVDGSKPARFFTSPNPVCPDWVAAADQYESGTANWRRETNISMPVGQWSQEQKALTDSVIPTMRASADTLEELGRRSGNPVFEDFAQLAAQYLRAYVQALPTYSVADGHLYDVGILPVGMVRRACEAA